MLSRWLGAIDLLAVRHSDEQDLRLSKCAKDSV
jgi:hypothetical protein